mmetsp:Transcript_38458/g.34005  ORF Transcript_38458/g.34005 Transcript_38458/m.34005 type:complete len:727 (-) Transcript_38458:186-2366(-)
MSTKLIAIPFLIIILSLIEAIKSQLTGSDYELRPEYTLTNGSHPNIIFILADDWGMNDVGWTHENTDTKTPYLDNLAKTEGLILTNYYAERVCTASRAAFLTGRYPSHLGLQSGVCAPNQPASLTRQVSMLSNEFQESGYSTHLIGKWHLGMMSYEYTPTYRGFDSFYGYWAGGEDYWNHKSWSFMRQISSTDLFINEKPALYQYGDKYSHPYDGVYGPWWQKSEALKLLQTKVLFPDKTPPFFFYFAMQASHSPRQAPPEYMALYQDGPNGDSNNRVTFQAQTTTADDVVKDVVEYLKRANLWDNTLVIIGSDNGAKRHYGDNAPYRGFKNTSWEGGVKVPGFVTGGYLPEEQRGKVLDYPMHFVDWYPTLLSAAGLDVNYHRSRKLYETEENFDADTRTFFPDRRWDDTPNQELDGIDMWDYISGEDEDDAYFDQKREVLLDLKEVWCPFSSCGALRIGRYKFIRGDNIASLLPDYDDGDKWFRGYCYNESKAELFCMKNELEFEMTHKVPGFTINSVGCVNSKHGCLFDLTLDPCEYYDLSTKYPDLVEKFSKRMDKFQEMATEPLMGENNADELFGKEIIQPERVCHNPSFWCPFKKYKDVEFEYKLFKRPPMPQQNDPNVWNVKQWIIYIAIPIFIALIIITCIVYYCFCKDRRNRNMNSNHHQTLSNHKSTDSTDIIEDISEVQPLKSQNESDATTRIINLGNTQNNNDTKYGSTSIHQR